MTTEQQLPEGIIPNSVEHVEWLINPRYEVIAPDTSERLVVGHVFHKWAYRPPAPTGSYGYVTTPESPVQGVMMGRVSIETMTHLFNPLPWYAKRTESQLPKYVKFKNGEVVEWNNTIAQMVKYGDIMPATKAEYSKQEDIDWAKREIKRYEDNQE